MTENSVKRMLKKLEKIGNEETAIKMLNQAEDKCWLDVYEIKEENNGNNNYRQFGNSKKERNTAEYEAEYPNGEW